MTNWVKGKTKRDRYWEQCDQIGLFLKVLGDKICCKSISNICWLLALFWKHQFSRGCFLCNFCKILGCFRYISVSGHTDWETRETEYQTSWKWGVCCSSSRKLFFSLKHFFECLFTLISCEPHLLSHQSNSNIGDFEILLQFQIAEEEVTTSVTRLGQFLKMSQRQKWFEK